MAILENFGRMFVVFNANDFLHRNFYFDFLKNNSWANCPVRFELEAPYLDIVTMIKDKMLNYYIQQERQSEAG